MRTSIVAITLVISIWSGPGARAARDLTSLPKYLPYQEAPSKFTGQHRPKNFYCGKAMALLDLDHDGQSEIIYSAQRYLAAQAYPDSGSALYYQTNYLPNQGGTTDPLTSPALNLCGDLDGDGLQDLVVLGPTAGTDHWWYWIVDPYSGEVKHRYTLPAGPDSRADGKWDGLYYPLGSLNVARDGVEVRALLFCCTVGFDKYGRGLLAVDPRDGTILWRYVTGPNPFWWNVQLADLDRDGQTEIVMLGRSPDNLGGEKINGFSDDETRLFVLNRQGNLLWSRKLCGSFGGGCLALGDLDGDGLPEIVTSAETTPRIWGELVVWNGAGTPLDRLESPRQLKSLNLMDRSDQASPTILITDSGGQLQEFDFREGALQLRQAVDLGKICIMNYVGDFLPEPGMEIVVTELAGRTMVLSQDLNPLFTSPEHGRIWASKAMVWQVAANTPVLVWPSIAEKPLIIAGAPFAWRRVQPYGATAAVLVLLGILWSFRRRQPRIDKHLLHETRLNLLDNLELSGHGAIAPLKCVRRLTWHLRALQTGLGDKDKVEIRMREAWSECRESALPHLSGIIDRAQLAGIGTSQLGTASEAITMISKQLDALEQVDFQISRDPEIADRLETAERQADAALIRLRAEVATYFRADLVQTVARVQKANALSLSQTKVAFQMGLAAAAAGGSDQIELPPTVSALCASHELEFVLDNLVGNAITAMKSAAVRQLSLSWRVADGMVLIDVTDTGCGLAEECWERALNSRYSSKPSGGEGLPRSRKYLRKYGGDLSLVRSAPGEGSTFRVTLPVN